MENRHREKRSVSVIDGKKKEDDVAAVPWWQNLNDQEWMAPFFTRTRSSRVFPAWLWTMTTESRRSRSETVGSHDGWRQIRTKTVFHASCRRGNFSLSSLSFLFSISFSHTHIYLSFRILFLSWRNNQRRILSFFRWVSWLRRPSQNFEPVESSSGSSTSMACAHSTGSKRKKKERTNVQNDLLFLSLCPLLTHPRRRRKTRHQSLTWFRRGRGWERCLGQRGWTGA